MIPLILLGLGLALVIIGSVADLRWREVPDWSNYAGIIAALMIRATYSIGTQEWSWILQGVLGLFAMYVLASALFYLGQWGGGDSKLLMAMGAVFGLGFGGQGYLNLFGGEKLLGAFLMNLLLFGGAWGALWSVKLAVMRRSLVYGAYHSLMRKAQIAHARSLVFIVALCLMAAAFIFERFPIRFPFIVLAVTSIITFYTYIFAKSVEKVCFVKDVSVDNLEDGDWIQHDIFVHGRRVCGPADLGVSRAQIAALKRAGIKEVRIKEGVPFVPSFFLAYAATVLVGNVFFAFAAL